jgi:hypothetical protein
MVDAEGCEKGQKPADYCFEVLNQVSSQVSKGYFVCFQIALNDTAKKHDVVANGRAERKSAKEAAFGNMMKGKRSPLC